MSLHDDETATKVSLGRPIFHVVASSGWMNDPCAPGYIPSSKEFTLMYQWNPYSHLWDDISWGHVKSKDLVHWEHVGDKPVFRPDQPYDKEGIFTGCFHPGPIETSSNRAESSKTTQDQVAIFYTSVPKLPVHWTREHARGQEGVACAVSDDGGQTWTKHSSNPILHAEPPHLTVTGFRDPSVIGWTALDRLLGRPESTGVYAIISGGVQQPADTTGADEAQGPRLFLYDINPRNMLEWNYISTLGQSYPRNVVPHNWTGDFGANWECATIIPLRDDKSGEQRDVCILGTEGGALRTHVEDYRTRNPGSKERDARYVHWFFTRLSQGSDSKGGKDGQSHATDRIDIEYTTGGLLDWAELYALATCPHPDGRRVAWGWLVELDLTDKQAESKGWTGCLGLPRQLGLKVYDRVVGTIGSNLEAIGSFEIKSVEQGGKNVNRLVTLGVDPLEELSLLRRSSLLSSNCLSTQQMPECFELVLTASLLSETPKDITITLRADLSAESTVETRITFSPTTERISICRERSSPRTDTYTGICTQDEQAPSTLLRFEDGHIEDLQMRIFIDRDIIELFVNGRLALSTRVYAPKEANEFKLDAGEGWQVKQLEAWEMGDIGLAV